MTTVDVSADTSLPQAGEATAEKAPKAAGRVEGGPAFRAKMSTLARDSVKTVIGASMVGTAIEFYDFYAYGTASANYFPKIFFPEANPTVGLLASLLTFAIAFTARPLGSLLFGHFGDRMGRKTTLVVSLLLMGCATVLIGCLPTYGTWGLLSVVLLCACRFVQGIGLGGEWSGAALVATENAPAGKRAWYGTFPQLGAPLGFIIANGLFLVINLALPHPDNPLLKSEAFLTWGWRVPFLFSAIMVVIGLWVRLRLVESAAFRQAERVGAIRKLPLSATFRHHWRGLILGTFIMLATYVLFYLMTSFTLTYGTAKQDAHPGGLGIPYTTFVLMQIIGVVFFGLFTLLSGPVADVIGRRKLLIWTTVAIIVFGVSFPIWLSLRPDLMFTGALTQAFLIFGFTLMGVTFGPMGAVLPELFPTNVRYTGSAIAYNVSSILGAALAPIIAVALWAQAGGSTWMVGVYLAGASVLTLIALLLTPETKDTDYDLASIEAELGVGEELTASV